MFIKELENAYKKWGEIRKNKINDDKFKEENALSEKIDSFIYLFGTLISGVIINMINTSLSDAKADIFSGCKNKFYDNIFIEK